MRFSTGTNGYLAFSAGCLLAATMALVCFANTAAANDGLTSNAIIHRAGLTVDWFTHSGAGSSGQLTDWYINVNENKPTTFFTIAAGKYREKFSQNTLNPFGEPYGIEGAREYIGIRSDILKAEFKNDGITDVEIKVSEYMLPETTIYALTSNAIVKAIDGDTGETKWSSNVGSPGLPSIGVGANDEYVAVVNGSTLYCLTADTGMIKWTAKCQYAVSASPSISDEKIYVPLLDGRIEAFELEKKGVNSVTYVSKGRVTSRPIITEKTVAWPTSIGDLNVGARFGKKPGVAYRLRSDDAIVSLPVYKENMFFVTSLDGFVYAVNEERGVVEWQVSTGQSISQAPIALGNYVYVINDKHEMYKIGAKSGLDAPGWESPKTNISRFVGAGKENMYVVDGFGNLMVMSQDSGAVLSSVKVGGIKGVLPNRLSDRMYMISNQGMIQCIREIASPVPHFHSNEFVAIDIDPAAAKGKTDGSGQAKPGATDLDDPFGGGSKPADTPITDADDPFGGGGKPADAPDDAGGNPFGGGAASGTDTKPDDDDPFK